MRKNIDANTTKKSCETNNNPINSNESNTTEIMQNLTVENSNRVVIGHFKLNLIRH